ncbi:MAG TPA: DUF4214 domain-containing protein [Telluria sp.]|nr:DUF4214 domain-containing protein [Telluria sp.]
MAIDYQITNAAHKYGLDSMAVTPALGATQDAIMGSTLGTINSWGTGPILVGQSGVATTTFSGGFTEKVSLVYTDTVNGVITRVDISATPTGEALIAASGSLSFTAATAGTALQIQNIFSGNDHISGNAYNNILRGYGANDRIEGGGGTDTVVLSGLSSQYQITRTGTAITTSGPDGVDALVNISRLQFDDKNIAYDLTGNAGMAYRVYQAAFNRAPDSAGLGYWIKSMDGGMALTDVASGFMNSSEFQVMYGTHPTSLSMVGKFYQNVLHRAPDQAGLDYWVSVLDTHAATGAFVLASFGESPENQAQVVGSIQNGISYMPFGG